MTLASNVLENLVKVYIEQYHGQDSKNLENTLRSIRSVLAGETIPEESPDLSPLEHLKGEDLEAKLQEILKIRPPLPQELGDETWKDPPEPRQWLAKDWLPAGEIALLTGPGSTGKSLLTLQFGAALACDRDILRTNRGWLPAFDGAGHNLVLASDPVTVVIATWEDSRDEMLRRRERLAKVCPWALAQNSETGINKRLRVLPMRAFGPVWAPAQHAHIATLSELTRTGAALRAYCEAHDARLLIMDTLAHALTTDENNRSLVVRALDAWAGWAAESGCAVLLTGHPSKSGDGESKDYSGSTAWRGSVRTMWTLRKPDDAAADESQDYREMGDAIPERTARLTLNKANYGPDNIFLDLKTAHKRAGWQVAPKEETGTTRRTRKESPSTQGGILADRNKPPV